MSARPHTALPLEPPATSGRSRAPARGSIGWCGTGLLPASRAAGAEVVVVIDGVVSVSVVAPSGRVIGLAVLGGGDVWTSRPGDDGLEAVRVEALCPSRLHLLTLDALLDVAADPAGNAWLVPALLRRAGNAERQYAARAALPVEDRIALLLRHLAGLRGVAVAGGSRRIDLDLSQDRIATLTGTTRESVNRAMRGLSRRGLVRREGLRYEVAGGGS